jgi:hypothetical protein
MHAAVYVLRIHFPQEEVHVRAFVQCGQNLDIDVLGGAFLMPIWVGGWVCLFRFLKYFG